MLFNVYLPKLFSTSLIFKSDRRSEISLGSLSFMVRNWSIGASLLLASNFNIPKSRKMTEKCCIRRFCTCALWFEQCYKMCAVVMLCCTLNKSAKQKLQSLVALWRTETSALDTSYNARRRCLKYWILCHYAPEIFKMWSWGCMVWNFCNFYANQIFRLKSILTNFKVSKTAIWTNLEALNFEFSEFVQFLKAQFYQNSKSRVCKTFKMAVFETQILPKIDFTGRNILSPQLNTNSILDLPLTFWKFLEHSVCR